MKTNHELQIGAFILL